MINGQDAGVLLFMYVLVKIWPPTIPPKDEMRTVQFLWGYLNFNVSSEAQMMLIVILTGALGSYVHAATSFVNFTGTRSILGSWRWWYLLRPFIGSALALGFFFVVRAGFFAPSAGTANFNLIGFAAMAFMVGMFTRQARQSSPSCLIPCSKYARKLNLLTPLKLTR